MSVLESYANPQGADFENLELDQAETLDKLNKEAYFRNGIVMKHAQMALLEVDPANRKLKALQQPPPPASIVGRVLERVKREEARQAATRETAT